MCGCFPSYHSFQRAVVMLKRLRFACWVVKLRGSFFFQRHFFALFCPLSRTPNVVTRHLVITFLFRSPFSSYVVFCFRHVRDPLHFLSSAKLKSKPRPVRSVFSPSSPAGFFSHACARDKFSCSVRCFASDLVFQRALAFAFVLFFPPISELWSKKSCYHCHLWWNPLIFCGRE